MHPAAIILIFAFLLLVILTGVVVVEKSGSGLLRFFRIESKTVKNKISGVVYKGSAVMIGAFMVMYGIRGIYRLLLTD